MYSCMTHIRMTVDDTRKIISIPMHQSYHIYDRTNRYSSNMPVSPEAEHVSLVRVASGQLSPPAPAHGRGKVARAFAYAVMPTVTPLVYPANARPCSLASQTREILAERCSRGLVLDSLHRVLVPAPKQVSGRAWPVGMAEHALGAHAIHVSHFRL